MMQTKVEILKQKIKRIMEGTDEAMKDFITIVACHRGSIKPDSISTSFRGFLKKYGEKKFIEVKDYLIEEGIIFIPGSSYYQPIQFSVKNEKGEYDYQQGEKLSKIFGEVIFESKPVIKEVIDELISEPEDKEFLKYIAKQNGVHICDGIEPEIKEIIGKHTYDRILSKLLEVGVLNEYAWSSRKHGYSGYNLLPFIDDYIKLKLGIFELEENEKIILAYIEFIHKIFSSPTEWFVWFNYPSEYEHKILNECGLAQKFLASVIYRSEEEVKKIIEKLISRGLISKTDLGYTRSGSHRGIVLQLSQTGREIAKQEENMLIRKVENRIKEIFSEKDTKIVYHLFSRERIPLKLLSLIKRSSVDILVATGIINDRGAIQFNEKTSVYEYVHSGIKEDEIRKWLRERCDRILSREEKLLIGFLSESKDIVIGKYPDWRRWNSVTTRTQRNYKREYDALIENFPYLKHLFSKLTNLTVEEVDKIISSLEGKGFLIREEAACGFPGYTLIYRIPVRFNFEFDLSSIKSKVREYIKFLAKDIKKNYKQLIFLDYLVRYYEKHQCNFIVDSTSIKNQLLQLLNYTPPTEYSPIYAFENNVILLYPPIKDQLKREIYELKIKLMEPLKSFLQELTKDYKDNIVYNYSVKSKKDGYFILEIESPDPSVGMVSFIVIPWITPLDIQDIGSQCIKSNTVNLFTFYPNYPQLKTMVTLDRRYNLIVIRDDTAYLFSKKIDRITRTIIVKLGEKFKVIEQEEVKRKREKIEELMERYPNLMKVRFIIPEVEELLRNAIRPCLVREFGDSWQDKIKQYFPKAETKRQKWEKKHGEKTDILQGISIGDFISLFENKIFSFLKDCFKDFGLAKASLVIFLKKKEYHHGKPKDEKDISDEEVDMVETAYRTLNDMIKK